jgi:hypothetical protein
VIFGPYPEAEEDEHRERFRFPFDGLLPERYWH